MPTPSLTTTAAVASYEQGVDVASFQHPGGAAIDWSQAAASGIRFAAVKATEGAYYQNPYALSDLAQARAAGLSVAAYAFAIPTGNGSSSDPATQADYLLNYLGTESSTVPIMLDIEYNPYGGECYGLNATAMVSWISAFDAEIQAQTGHLPIIYAPPGGGATVPAAAPRSARSPCGFRITRVRAARACPRAGRAGPCGSTPAREPCRESRTPGTRTWIRRLPC